MYFPPLLSPTEYIFFPLLSFFCFIPRSVFPLKDLGLIFLHLGGWGEGWYTVYRYLVRWGGAVLFKIIVKDCLYLHMYDKVHYVRLHA
jgi:hypothetical protein